MYSLVFVSIEKIYKTLRTVFDHISKPLKNTPLRVVLGSLRNHDGDAEDNVG